MSSRFPIPVVGLTGGIASGKSLVSKILREKANIPVLDADQISRDLSAPGGRAAGEIQKIFGTLDRAQLRKKIFSDPSAKAQLEAILHPLIRDESLREVADLARAGAKLAFYEATLLVETGRYKDFDALLVIEAPPETQIARVMERDGSTREQAQAILRAQASNEQRAHAATWVIQNSGSPADLEREILERIPQFIEHLGRRQ